MNDVITQYPKMKIKLTVIFSLLFMFHVSAQKKQVWVDSDSGNEMDDLYAITCLLLDTTVDLVGVSSAHFNNPDLLTKKDWNSYPTKKINTVKISQQLNEKLLKLTHKEYIPHPIGAKQMIGCAWGGQEPVPSPASAMIIEKAQKIKPGEKLDVIVIGASSNISSALLADSTIKSKIHIYLLGAQFDVAKNVWNKNEFNVRNDLNSFDYLLNLDGLELTIMPANITYDLQLTRKIAKENLENRNELFQFLYSRSNLVGAKETWVMWDLALIEAYLHPNLASQQTVKTPQENKQRNISAYTSIDHQKMEEVFLSRILSFKIK